MSTLAISSRDIYPSSYGSALATPQTPRKINRILDIVPADLQKNHETKETLWNVAAIVSTLGYLTLISGAFATTVYFAPQYALLATFSCFLTLPSAVNGLMAIKNKIQEHHAQNEKFTRIAKFMQN